MKLNDLAIRKTQPTSKIKKLSDGFGLQLWIMPTGSRAWHFAYRFDGKQRRLAFGPYPTVTLAAARQKREEARKVLAGGKDPDQEAKATVREHAANVANTFESIANELLAKKRAEGAANATLTKNEWLLRLVQDGLGSRPVKEITAAEVLTALRQIEARGKRETAHRARSFVGEVFRYAIATSRAETDPTFALRNALLKVQAKNRAAIVEPGPFGEMLRAIDGYNGSPETRAGLQLMALTFVRPVELRMARWTDFDLDNAVWSVPLELMKMRRPHFVPLARQTILLLRELRLVTGNRDFLFPSVRDPKRCMSENTLNAALRRLDYTSDEMCAHGFRASASSMLNESGLWNESAIEVQLSHVDEDEVRRAYNRARYWSERVRMMQWWADRIDEMRSEKPAMHVGGSLS